MPLTGEEVSLVRLEANPADYIGKKFIICGGISIQSYYNFGYSDAAQTHYSLDFRSVDAKGRLSRESANLYLSKNMGRAFSEFAAKAKEDGADAMLVRLESIVYPNRIGRHHDQILDSIEVTDWQFYDWDRKAWTPWVFGGVTEGFLALHHIGKAAVPALVDIVISDTVYQNETIDSMLRAGAKTILTAKDPVTKREVLESAPTPVAFVSPDKSQGNPVPVL